MRLSLFGFLRVHGIQSHRVGQVGLRYFALWLTCSLLLIHTCFPLAASAQQGLSPLSSPGVPPLVSSGAPAPSVLSPQANLSSCCAPCPKACKQFCRLCVTTFLFPSENPLSYTLNPILKPVFTFLVPVLNLPPLRQVILLLFPPVDD